MRRRDDIRFVNYRQNLQFDEFSESVRVLFGRDVKNSDIQTIFQKIRTNPDARIDWSEVFGYHDNGADDDDDVFGRRLDRERVFAIPQRTRIGEAAGDRKRRDVVAVIKYIQSLDCYVTVSLKGSLAVWRPKNANNFRLQSCMDVGDKSWVTAGDFLPNVRRMAVCQERSISLYDVRVSGKKQEVQRFVVHPLETSVQCAVAVTSATPTHSDVILYGDDDGHVGMMTIDANDLTTAKTSSSRPNAQTGVSAAVTLDPNRLTHQRHRRKFHNEWVFKVKYIPQLRCFGSCSTDSTSSFVLGSLDAITDDRPVKGFSLARGVNAFDYCISANLIATGGADKTIRVWHSSIFTAPVGKLVGHLFTIVDIVINQFDQHIISLSSARVIRVWDINAMSSLQVFMNSDDIHGEKKIYSIFYNEKYEHLITGSSVLDMWPLTRAVQDQLQIPHTHDRSVTQMLINGALNQLVTACAESTLKTWDLATGRLLSTNAAGHGRDLDVTALAVDLSGYRLASGAVDGSVRIWEASSCRELKRREPPKGNSFEDGSKVIRLDYCVVDGVRCVLAAGCNNFVRILDESKTSRDLPTLKEMDCSVLFSEIIRTSGGFELTLPPIPVKTPILNDNAKVTSTDRDEIRAEMTCADLLNANGVNVFATGFNNGKAILWDLIRMKAEYVCHALEGEENGTKKNSNIVDRTASQSVLAMKFLRLRTSNAFSYRTSNKDQRKSTDVSLQQRHSVSSRESSDEIVDQSGRLRDQSDLSDVLLVTCHADASIRFWDLQGNLLGDVYVDDQEAKVTACTSDLSCRRLFTADDKGYVTVWKMDEFLETMENTDHVEQILSWRAHMTPIIQMAYVNESEAILTASTDCSVRVWSSKTGSYLGYFGQTERFDLSSSSQRPSRSKFSSAAERLPYDISEVPQSPERRVRESDRARLREEAKRLVEYPLSFDDKRWIPLRRSAYLHNRGVGRMPSNLVPSSNRKFFKALKKSAPRKNLVESYVTGDVTQGSVYRSLPVYMMSTPERVKTPEFTLPKIQDDPSSPFRGSRIGGGSREMEADNKEDINEVQVSTRPKKKKKMSISK